MVPEGWAARHRPVVAGFFHDRVTIQRLNPEATWTDELGTEHEVWEDVTTEPIPAQVQVVHSMALDQRDASGRPVVISDYTARLDVEWIPDDGDRLTVVSSPDPANLGAYIVQRRESQTHVVDRTLHLSRVAGGLTT